jgi:proteic killer suppression protein
MGLFSDRATEDLFAGVNSKAARKVLSVELHHKARIKLTLLNAAVVLNSLADPPGNQLKELSGNWKGYHQIRINDVYRIRFRWVDGLGVEDVQIRDFHNE